MSAPDTTPPKCPTCEGRGYHLCECWPGDCICGFGDETCEDCDGEGVIWADDDDLDWDEYEGGPIHDHA